MDFDEINGAGGLRRNAYALLDRMSDAGSPRAVTQATNVFNLLINMDFRYAFRSAMTTPKGKSVV
jgi:hypothetical protein